MGQRQPDGRLKVEEKSNEMTAIPRLLELLDIEGNIITIDAMGTQTAIAEKIIDNGADYILSVKDNQQELMGQITSRFDKQQPYSTDADTEKGYGRLETKQYDGITRLDFIHNSEL